MIGAIVMGIWALVFMISFTVGMVKSYVDNAIENSVSHIQAHVPDFTRDQEPKYYFQDVGQKLSGLKDLEGIKGVTARTLVNGMLSTGKGARGIQIRGVDKDAERAVTHLAEKIKDGTYFEESGRNPILVGKRLADKLGLRVRSKVVLTFRDLSGNITAAAFRVAGLFATDSSPFDESSVFVLRDDLNRLMGQEDMAHEIAIVLNDIEQLEAERTAVQQLLPDLKVETYREVSPDLQLYEGQIQTSANIFMTIIMLALLFGIVNTMLMAVLERYRELGMLMAIGMNKLRIFSMIVLETIMLALVALLPGLLIGWLTVSYFNRTGIDLSAFSAGMQQFGMSSVVYTDLHPEIYLQLAGAVGLTAVIGALYPAVKAVRLKPVEAMRKV